MNIKIWTAGLTGIALLTAALATGSAILFMAGILLILITVLSVAGVQWAARTMTVSSELSDDTVKRGADVNLWISVRHRGFLPIAPVTLTLDSPEGETLEARLRDAPGRQQRLSLPFHAAHAGLLSPGLRTVEISDLFGLYKITRPAPQDQKKLLVLPVPFEVEEMPYAPGDATMETIARATEDVSSPSGFRNYQSGDALKKIHWKLSLRRNELIVRTFDEPVLSEALILMDCSPPPAYGHPEAAADVRDALLETAASVALKQMRGDHEFRLPLMGAHPVEIEKSSGEEQLLENLARLDFSETDKFERVLLMESRRLGKVGAALIVSARLNSAMVDAMVRMRRMGPYVRLYLMTFVPDDAQLTPMVSRLRRASVEVRFVEPRQA